MPKVELDKVRINYEVRGEGQPIVFLHGLGASWKMWIPQIDSFSSKYKMIMLDMSKNKRYVHYEAIRTSNSLGIWVGPGKSKTKAISRLKSGWDTWSIGSSNALSITKRCFPNWTI